MAKAIRILGLNDDNHATQFFSEDQIIQMYGHEIIPFLAQAHTVNYDVRGMYICDLPPLDYTSDQPDLFELAFDTLSGCAAHMTFEEAFNILWAVSSENIYL